MSKEAHSHGVRRIDGLIPVRRVVTPSLEEVRARRVAAVNDPFRGQPVHDDGAGAYVVAGEEYTGYPGRTSDPDTEED